MTTANRKLLAWVRESTELRQSERARRRDGSPREYPDLSRSTRASGVFPGARGKTNPAMLIPALLVWKGAGAAPERRLNGAATG